MNKLRVVMTSPVTGFIKLPPSIQHYDGLHASFERTLHVPARCVVVVSFPAVPFVTPRTCQRGLQVFKNALNGSRTLAWAQCANMDTSPQLHSDVSSITIRVLRLDWHCYSANGLRLAFSFHSSHGGELSPDTHSNAQFRCSLKFLQLKHHLVCNRKAECSSTESKGKECRVEHLAPEGFAVTENRCFKLISTEDVKAAGGDEELWFIKSKKYCKSIGGKIVSFLTKEDYNLLFEYIAHKCMYTKKTYASIMIGTYIHMLSFPILYRRRLITEDKTVLFRPTMHNFTAVLHHPEPCFYCLLLTLPPDTHCAKLNLPNVYYSHDKQCCHSHVKDFYTKVGATVCEIPQSLHLYMNQKPKLKIELANITFSLVHKNLSVVQCQHKHVIHSFLICDPRTECLEDQKLSQSSCVFPGNVSNAERLYQPSKTTERTFDQFSCDKDQTKVSYTLVCDHRQDCQDRTDEVFCVFPCTGYSCASKQCLSADKKCDYFWDCLDNSDELLCSFYRYTFINTTFTDRALWPPPVLVNFDADSSVQQRKMKWDEDCPDTHFRCPGKFNDCFPVYTRCNGYHDCLGHEDEADCENLTCPGFYGCFNSTVCVHGDQLCDGMPQCPHRDDEWLCTLAPCPSACLCLGLSFSCADSFPAEHFLQLKYLYAKGSGITLSDLRLNIYLIYLNLAKCSLTSIPNIDLPNLRLLYLDENELQHANMSTFMGFGNLQMLSLSTNPLTVLYRNQDSFSPNFELKIIDISNCKLSTLSSKVFSRFWKLHTINMSSNSIHTICEEGFTYPRQLAILHMDNNPLKFFPRHLFQNASRLHMINAPNYKLCCKQVLPATFEENFCYSPKEELSSCEDLLHYEIYRGFLWMIGVLSLFGNLFCFLVRFCVQSQVSKSGFRVFVTSLCLADFLMGVYIGIIGIVDEVFRGQYVFHASTWTSSSTCKVAGFLSLLSSEVSALTIWLITLDRFIVLRFPFSTLRFGRFSAAVACAVTWFLGFLLALIPLLPALSDWQFYSQTGLCIPLPVTRQEFKGRMYSYSVMIVFNFILFVLIGSGQISIYWSVQKNAMVSDATTMSRDRTVARRLITVALTDFACWFPIGMSGLLSSVGVPIGGEVNVAVAIFVLPLNSALNPFIYMINTLQEKKRQRNEAALVEWLEEHLNVAENA